MRAVYVPTPTGPLGVAGMVLTAPAGDGSGELTLYAADGTAPRCVALSAQQLRGVLRQWAAAARTGQAEVEFGD